MEQATFRDHPEEYVLCSALTKCLEFGVLEYAQLLNWLGGPESAIKQTGDLDTFLQKTGKSAKDIVRDHMNQKRPYMSIQTYLDLKASTAVSLLRYFIGEGLMKPQWIYETIGFTAWSRAIGLETLYRKLFNQKHECSSSIMAIIAIETIVAMVNCRARDALLVLKDIGAKQFTKEAEDAIPSGPAGDRTRGIMRRAGIALFYEAQGPENLQLAQIEAKSIFDEFQPSDLCGLLGAVGVDRLLRPVRAYAREQGWAHEQEHEEPLWRATVHPPSSGIPAVRPTGRQQPPGTRKTPLAPSTPAMPPLRTPKI
ncbi:MAG: hypothetical protein WCV84_03120 [Patescibacteria group bacterium]